MNKPSNTHLIGGREMYGTNEDTSDRITLRSELNFRESPPGAKNAEVTESLVEKLHSTFSNGLPIATPISTSRTNEFELVQALLRMLQGFSSYFFYWDDKEQTFCHKTGVYLSHLSQTSLNGILNQFISSATCLQFVEVFVKKVESSLRSPPTLRAFAHSVSVWLKRLKHAALEEENKMMDRSTEMTPTLLGLSNALSSLCSGAEYLQQVVDGVAASVNIEHGSSVPANEIAVHILDHLYKKLNEVCLVQGGEEEAYLMLLFIFLGSSLPYVEALDSWLYDGILDDPYEELFFFANNAITISQAEFWEKSYLLRPQCRMLSPGTSTINGGVSVESMASGKVMSNREAISISVRGKDRNNIDLVACPSFLKDIAMAIVSAGKSLQLIQHTTKEYLAPQRSCDSHETDGFGRSKVVSGSDEMRHEKNIGRLTLSEIFCVSLVGLIGDGDHINKHLRQGDQSKSRMEKMFELYLDGTKLKQEDFDTTTTSLCSDRNWFKILANTKIQKGNIGTESSGLYCFNTVNEGDKNLSSLDHPPFPQSFCVENPVITVCQTLLNKNRASHDKLVVSRNFHLPPLNDEGLYEAVFREMDGTFSVPKETNYMFGFQYGESDYIRSKEEMKTLELLYPFPTLLPSFQEDLHITELFPVQENSTLTARILNWIQGVVPKDTPLPVVILQECLVVYIKEQVNYVGQHILLKLMHGWRLMDELGVLRAIYLLGSGDLLQQFLTVLFDKLDKGESWDDDFELNTVLQESIRNSADSSMLLSLPDSLVVSITKHDAEGNEQYSTQSTNLKGRSPQFGIDTLDMLKFMYKVSWPLELIANSEAIKKYNQVMNFLLKVKRAKFVLDKARRWMWKGRGAITSNQKHHWLVEQKLLHFVDALHQYVMDRVFHNSWLELCEGIALAGSLDEVIEVHDAYLLSIQRQCFVAPDKLWALIASRIKSILGLALDFYAVQQTLSSSGAALAIKARCEMEINRIEKQFDDCIAFLLRVLSFKLNVGHFPHLADLVTRINYNYFYMSDSGNLVTVPGSDATASKLVKASTVRPD